MRGIVQTFALVRSAVLPAISEPQQIVAGYTLVEQLGAGGYGEVWRAAAPGGLSKAVKIIFGSFGSARADRELKSLDRIKDVRHPFLLSLERIEIVDGRLVIVTELADMSLKDRFQQCGLSGMHGIPRAELLGHLRDAAEALDFMHDRYALQHMDVKPENLLLVGGRLKVADFGLVKDLHDISVSILDAMTPAYAAPELFDGTPSTHSDQYSLAVVYVQMLCGSLPFTARSFAEWAQTHIAAARRPNLEALPLADRRTIDRALARLPVDRFASCGEMVAALAGQSAARVTVPENLAHGFSDSEQITAAVARGARPQPSRCDATATSRVAIERRAPPHASNPSEAETSDGGTTHIRRAQPAIAKLELDEQPDAWRPAPTLLIGIGGAGATIVGRVCKRLAERFGAAAAYPSWSVLTVDTDAEALDRAASIDAHVARGDALHIPLRSTQEYRDQSHDLLKWLSRRWLYNIPPSRRTQGFRPLGRLALVDHEARFSRSVRDRLSAIVDDAALEQSSACVGREFQRVPRVVVAASICGGTGSGAALDAGASIRNVLREMGHGEARVLGFFFVSSTRDAENRDLALADAYAFLGELNYCAVRDKRASADAASDAVVAPRAAPFDDAYVVHLGQSLSDEDFERECELAAEYLYLDLATPVGQTLDRCRARPSHADSYQEPHTCVRSFRLAPLTYPGSELTNLILPRILSEIAAHWFGHRAPPRVASNEQSALTRVSDEDREEAAERVHRFLGRKLRFDFLRMVTALAAHARRGDRPAVWGIDSALSAMRAECQAWQSGEHPRESRVIVAGDEAYRHALETALDEHAVGFIERAAARIAVDALDETARALEAGSADDVSALDLLRCLPGRAARMAHDDLERWIAETDLTRWLARALGDPKHAVLCMRTFVRQAEPAPLAVGGERYLCVVAPDRPTGQAVAEMLDTALAEKAAVAASETHSVWLLSEAQRICVLDLADHIIGGNELLERAAARLHTRIDVKWSDARS